MDSPLNEAAFAVPPQLQRIVELAEDDSQHPAALQSLGRVHLVGAAGSGMRSLAQLLLDRGSILTGSDTAPDGAAALAPMGWTIRGTHAAENLPPDADLLIYSDAVTSDNPELRRAAELGIPSWSYFQMLGRLMAEKHGIAIAGTHGKSSTTAMLAHLLSVAGRDPTFVYGAAPLGRISGGRAGRGPLMVAEACEYRENFLHLRPRSAAILGIEPDHFDYYATSDRLHEAFARFAALVPEEGLVVLNHACPAALRIGSRLACRVQTFGTNPEADWSARIVGCQRGCYRFELRCRGNSLVEVALAVPGRHQVLNALAAAALAWENGVEAEGIAAALAGFRGLHRRLEVLGTRRGITVVDDYAHHPTELAAALETVRQVFPGRRLWCVFQPHQVSRTARLLDELAASLENADYVVVAEIFRAREPHPTAGEVTAADLAARLRARGRWVADVHARDAIVRLLQSLLEPDDVLLSVGAGDIRETCNGIFDWLRKDRAAR